MIVDESLTWKHQFANDARKISKSIGIIYRSSFCLPDTSLRTLYYTLVYLYLLYCVSEWASTYPTNVKRIVILQKKIYSNFLQETIRCSHWSYIRSNKDICKYWSSMIYICFKLEILFLFMANKIIPEFQYFLLKFPARTNIRQGPNVFNSLNRNIQSAATFSLFNSRLKAFLLSWFSTCKYYSLLATFCRLSEQGSKKERAQKSMRWPGIEPGSTAWKAAMLTTIPPTPVLS